MNIKRQIITLNTLDMFYLDTQTEKPVIVCIHGRFGRGETWYDFMKHYGDQYRIIAPDLRGHGLSGKPVTGYTHYHMALDVKLLLEALGIEEAIIIGHSMGAFVAAELTVQLTKKIKGLALLDRTASGPSKEAYYHNMRNIKKETWQDSWPDFFATKEEALEFFQSIMPTDISCNYFMQSLMETVEGYVMMFDRDAIAENERSDVEWYDLLDQITCLTLVMREISGHAVSDEDYKIMCDRLSNSMSFTMDNSDHNVHLSNKKLFYGVMDQFLHNK